MGEGPEVPWPQVPSVSPCDQSEPARCGPGESVFSPWASSLQQGDVVSKVIMLMAQTAEAAPLTHHEAEWQHEEGADGRHDIGYGHER